MAQYHQRHHQVGIPSPADRAVACSPIAAAAHWTRPRRWRPPVIEQMYARLDDGTAVHALTGLAHLRAPDAATWLLTIELRMIEPDDTPRARPDHSHGPASHRPLSGAATQTAPSLASRRPR